MWYVQSGSSVWVKVIHQILGKGGGEMMWAVGVLGSWFRCNAAFLPTSQHIAHWAMYLLNLSFPFSPSCCEGVTQQYIINPTLLHLNTLPAHTPEPPLSRQSGINTDELNLTSAFLWPGQCPSGSIVETEGQCVSSAWIRRWRLRRRSC